MPDLNNHPIRQRGVSLLIVMVMMLLSALLVLGGARMTYLNEYLAGNDSDYQRAFEAAQMMLQDGELDIQATTDNQRSIPVSKMDSDFNSDLLSLASSDTDVPCIPIMDGKGNVGICSNLNTLVSGDPTTSFWNNPTLLASFTARGATYRQWTHTSTLATGSEKTSNPILAANPARAWYWIEILEFDKRQLRDAPDWILACVPAEASSSDGSKLFRITALALTRSLTPVVVQEYFVPKPQMDGSRRCP